MILKEKREASMTQPAGQFTFSWLFKKLLRWTIDSLLKVYSYFMTPDRKNVLPPISDPILLESAISLAAKIKLGQVKSRDVVQSYLERIKQVEPLLNAVIEFYPNSIKEAELIDEMVSAHLAGEKSENDPFEDKPLLGVPFTFKNSIEVKGMTISNGLVSRKDLVAEEDCQVVQNLRRAGAIPLALTNVPELLCFYDCYNKINGRTRNPYDLSRTPGGSSGGEGALIAAAGSLIGVGSDLAGSIRMPAAFCGIYGHKPTHATIPAAYSDAVDQAMTTLGPMCRYLEDVMPVFKAMAGTAITHLPKINDTVKLPELKYYYMLGDKDPLKTPLQNGPRDAVLKCVEHLKSLKFECVEIDVPEFNDSLFLWLRQYVELDPVRHTFALTDGKSDISLTYEFAKELFSMSKFTKQQLIFAVEVDIALRKRSKEIRDGNSSPKKVEALREKLSTLLGDNGILIYPTHPESAPKHHEALFRSRNMGYTAIFNLLNMPSTQCPVGFDSNGLPVGVQVISNTGCDHLTLAVAHEVDRAFGGWTPP